MLKVSRKIATEAGAESILRASYRLSAPLSVPTLILDPADYNPAAFNIATLLNEPIADRIMRKLRRVLYNHYGYGNAHVGSFLKSADKFRLKVTNALEGSLRGNQLAAYSFSKDQLFNVVICPRTTDTGMLLLKHGLRMKEENIAEMPGHNAQWNFIKLWHEFAHGRSGQSESQADQTSALIHQHVFADARPLMAFSDFRATQAIINHKDSEKISIHGWQLVDTIDRVLEMELPKVWQDTVELARLPAPSDPQIADVQFVGMSLRKISRLAFQEPDLWMLAKISDQMAREGRVENQNQLRIAKRFAKAANRLALGTPAYADALPVPSI